VSPVIRTLLVANRGEIACRIIRSAREMGMRTVAVHSDPDATAPHVAMADRAVALGGSTATESYLHGGKILDAARRSGADAVHPGYGFLSENADFALACAGAGIVFVGPTPEAIREMGLKHRAKEIARKAGVPVLADAVLDGDDPSRWAALGDEVGYPLLVKASAGGGGRGMRLVADPSALGEAVKGARREARSSFGDERVFLERWLPAPRHIEVQVLGDTHEHVVHLLERECSVQRRHQKVIEEAPSPVVTPALRERMGKTAVALAEALGYVGAGTVEFLVEGEGDGAEFFFLEMNTRLQVEHPVTEAVTGLDLVRLQLLVAMGEALPFSQADITPAGHAVEARLYAEDPAAGFAPTYGPLWRYAHADVPGVRYDDGVVSGGEVSTFYDSMLAKVIAHAPTRAEAAQRLARALAGMHLHGPGTNRDFLVRVLGEPDFLAGETRTDFIDLHPHLLVESISPQTALAHLAAAVATTVRRHRSNAPVAGFAPAGWRLFPGPGQRVNWQRAGADPVAVEYSVSGSSLSLVLDQAPAQVAFRHLGPELVQVELDGVEWPCSVHHAPDGTVWVNDADQQTCWRELPRLPETESAETGLGPVSEVPGTVLAVLAEPGQQVAAGDTLVVLEAMKMEHRVTAPRDGVVEEVRVSVGDYVDAHQLLVVLADEG
jgi:3-methylcrotonyl-CoA carboxylase alpha subunit